MSIDMVKDAAMCAVNQAGDFGRGIVAFGGGAVSNGVQVLASTPTIAAATARVAADWANPVSKASYAFSAVLLVAGAFGKELGEDMKGYIQIAFSAVTAPAAAILCVKGDTKQGGAVLGGMLLSAAAPKILELFKKAEETEEEKKLREANEAITKANDDKTAAKKVVDDAIKAAKEVKGEGPDDAAKAKDALEKASKIFADIEVKDDATEATKGVLNAAKEAAKAAADAADATPETVAKAVEDSDAVKAAAKHEELKKAEVKKEENKEEEKKEDKPANA